MKKTAEWGANKERTAILAKIRRMKKQDTCDDALCGLEAWLLLRNERYQKKRGGLGR